MSTIGQFFSSIKSVQKFSGGIAATTGTTIDMTISAVVIANCFIVGLSNNTDIALNEQTSWEVDFTTTTNIRATRLGSTSSTQNITGWVVEYHTQ